MKAGDDTNHQTGWSEAHTGGAFLFSGPKLLDK